jgi:hypothetical protein
MALPKIKHPTYEVVVPSSKQKINLRPFTVHEEKLLLMAKSSEKTEDVIKTVKQIIQNCIIEVVDVSKLATFDIEYLFIKLRAKSVGEEVELEYTDPSSEEVIKFKVNLDEIEVKTDPNHKNTIIITDNIGVKMRYPTIEEVFLIDASNEEEKIVMDVLYNCIESVYDDDEVYTEFTREEMISFINELPIGAMEKIKEFFETMPSVEKVVKLKNKKGDIKEITLRGINSFFT